MSIFLIRHGMTLANEMHCYCGSTDLPLSERGREELKGKQLSVPEGVTFVSSGMKRCNETVQLLFGDVEYQIIPEFREIDFGDFEMHSYEELKEDPLYQQWITGDNPSNIPPNGESGKQMEARVLAAFERIEENTVLVTHGGVIAAIMSSLFPEERKNLYQWQPKPGCGYCITNNTYTRI